MGRQLERRSSALRSWPNALRQGPTWHRARAWQREPPQWAGPRLAWGFPPFCITASSGRHRRHLPSTHQREPQALGGGLRLCSGVDRMQPPAVWDQWRPMRSGWCHRRRLCVRARCRTWWVFYHVKDEYYVVGAYPGGPPNRLARGMLCVLPTGAGGCYECCVVVLLRLRRDGPGVLRPSIQVMAIQLPGRVVGRYYALTLFSGSSDPACGFALLHS